jgi:hypothetical protein
MLLMPSDREWRPEVNFVYFDLTREGWFIGSCLRMSEAANFETDRVTILRLTLRPDNNLDCFKDGFSPNFQNYVGNIIFSVTTWTFSTRREPSSGATSTACRARWDQAKRPLHTLYTEMRVNRQMKLPAVIITFLLLHPVGGLSAGAQTDPGDRRRETYRQGQ